MENVIDTLWHEYQTTHFLFTQRLSDDFPFAIVTAYNPSGLLLTPSQNRLLDRQLQSKIQQFNSPYRALIGAAPDLSHMEKSWAVFIDKEQALELGKAFNQHAIYYVEQGLLSLVACNDSKMPEVELGVFNHRLRLVNELPDIGAHI
ncbi:DUF3293 domain-containing protein [Shewanella inventionis]|uniref:DUF3293 domain-containing protein n=1 Tax=Shewanella inventionis TaxID=1738770 RepID=A0ABQ1IWX0_9GAMM|nr:DUF3293 domain-containing protein [Shewanella inventionis]MCL1157000.1 DUF3293 domain-containing protein [Shewanella inventionis]UAL43162.1 DUF3293 domain-containing protein [Shewanella inventionis]GGB54426.1 hypothetical protein GCM10011607_13740 [Shewanella inventionis]